MKRNKNNAGEQPTAAIIICVAAGVVILALAVWFLFFRTSSDKNEPLGTSEVVIRNGDGETDTAVLDNIVPGSPFLPVDTDPLEDTSADTAAPSDSDGETSPLAGADIGQGLTLVDIGTYSGAYVEDGSDESVSGVLSIIVRNDGDRDIQYAEVYISVDNVFSCFKVTTLPAGASATVLENDRMEYKEGAVFEYAKVSNVAYFTSPASLHSDVFTITGRDGYINISNNSDTDINSDVVVYYKAVKDGMYFGGITYSVRASGGVGAKSSVLLAAPHFSLDNCKVMFVTYEK